MEKISSYGVSDGSYYEQLELVDFNTIAVSKYVSDSESLVELIDISNLQSPSFIGDYNASGYINDLLYHNNQLYVAAYEYLESVDISDRSNMEKVSSEFLYSKGYALTLIDDGLLFVGGGGTYSELVDISDPTSLYSELSFFGTQEVNETLYSVEKSILHNNYLYSISSINSAIGDRVSNAITSIDMSDKTSPKMVDGFNAGDVLPSRVDGHRGAVIYDNKLYVVGGMDYILEFDLNSDGTLTLNETIFTNKNISNLESDGKGNLILSLYYGKGLSLGNTIYERATGTA